MIIYLHSLQSPINIGLILRSAELFDAQVWLYDGHEALTSSEAKLTVSDFACGAAERSPIKILPLPLELPSHGFRSIVTSLSADAEPLCEFIRKENDIICIGNEYDGVPHYLSGCADHLLTIPLPRKFLPKPPSKFPIDPSRKSPPTGDGRPSLNTAVATSIILMDWYQKSSNTSL